MLASVKLNEHSGIDDSNIHNFFNRITIFQMVKNMFKVDIPFSFSECSTMMLESDCRNCYYECLLYNLSKDVSLIHEAKFSCSYEPFYYDIDSDQYINHILAANLELKHDIMEYYQGFNDSTILSNVNYIVLLAPSDNHFNSLFDTKWFRASSFRGTMSFENKIILYNFIWEDTLDFVINSLSIIFSLFKITE